MPASPRPSFADVPEARRRNLSAVRARDTKPELIVRRLLYLLGYRYRVQCRDLPGRPDIVFPRRRVVIEVRCCFWHRHPDSACRNAVLPRTRADWWAAKLSRNVERDHANQFALEAAGWKVLIVWECEVRGNRSALARKIAEFLGPPGSSENRGILTSRQVCRCESKGPVTLGEVLSTPGPAGE